MNTLSLRGFAVTALLALAAPVAMAGLVTEIETDGTAVNNSIGSAQAIPTLAFTSPVPPEVFNPPGYLTATIQGGNGLNDVDFYSFFSYGGRVYLDMDNNSPTFDPLVALFDSSGTLLAYGDDSELDDGSTNTIDSFLGSFLLPGAGVYYIGISEFANLPTAALTGTETPITRPDGGFGGVAVSGVVAGVSSYDFSDVQPGGATYNLNVSLQNPVPEPSTYALMATAAILLGLAHRGKRTGR